MLDPIVQVAQLAVGLCFGWAAVSKVAAFRRFEHGVASFEVLPPGMERTAAVAVVVIESLAALCLLAGPGRLWGAGFAVALLAIFAIAVTSARRRGVAATCACFGGDVGEAATPRTYWRLALLGAGVAVVGFDALARPGVDAAFSWAALVAAGCVVVGCTVLTDAAEAFAVALGGSRPGEPQAERY